MPEWMDDEDDNGFNSRTLGRVRLSTRSIRAIYAIVSIHAPWEGCDTPQRYTILTTHMFQFTHPGKGATVELLHVVQDVEVSIHAPWEGCDKSYHLQEAERDVSIHAPWEGCDP